jgi:hypothetical protein
MTLPETWVFGDAGWAWLEASAQDILLALCPVVIWLVVVAVIKRRYRAAVNELTMAPGRPIPEPAVCSRSGEHPLRFVRRPASMGGHLEPQLRRARLRVIGLTGVAGVVWAALNLVLVADVAKLGVLDALAALGLVGLVVWRVLHSAGVQERWSMPVLIGIGLLLFTGVGSWSPHPFSLALLIAPCMKALLHDRLRNLLLGTLAFAAIASGVAGAVVLPRAGLGLTLLWSVPFEVAVVVVAVPFIAFLQSKTQGKGISDMARQERGFFLIVTGLLLAGAARHGEGLSWAPVIALAAWLAITVVGTYAMPRPGPDHRLLLLRVFKAARTNRRLLESLQIRWRRVGSMHLISGPDLMDRTVTGPSLWGFLRKSLGGVFADGPEDLSRVVRAQQAQQDRVFPVNGVMCRDVSWKGAVLSLADAADVVLIDLRGFTPERAGVLYEVEHMFGLKDPGQVVLLVDTPELADQVQELVQDKWRAYERPHNGPVYLLVSPVAPALVATLCRASESAAPL